jgi:hypothetical protein
MKLMLRITRSNQWELQNAPDGCVLTIDILGGSGGKLTKAAYILFMKMFYYMYKDPASWRGLWEPKNILVKAVVHEKMNVKFIARGNRVLFRDIDLRMQKYIISMAKKGYVPSGIILNDYRLSEV